MDATTTALLDSLENQRAHVLGAVEGLDDEALHTPLAGTASGSCNTRHSMSNDSGLPT